MTILSAALLVAACGPPLGVFLTYVAALASGRPLSAARFKAGSVAGGMLALAPMVVIIVQWSRQYQFVALLLVSGGLAWALACSAVASATLRAMRRRQLRRLHRQLTSH